MNTIKNYSAKEIEFKFGDYISQGFELFKKDIGGFVLASFFVMIMSMIPLCGFMAIGNFYKFCRKKKRGQETSPSEIFNFDDFSPYLVLNLIVLAFVFAVMIPYFFLIFSMSALSDGGGSPILSMLSGLLIFAAIIVGYIFMLKAFYVSALISLEGEKDWKQAWKNSKIMTKNNLLIIFLFTFVISSISQLGIIACGIGIFLTIPIGYICNYMASEDGLNQIKKDEIDFIGTKTTY